MASSSADSGEQPSAAQKLFLDHHATVEDAPDEDQAGGPSGGDGGPSWGPTMSVKAAGKQKAQAPAAALDTQSQELFPSLGGPKKTSAGTVPTWGAKNGTNGKANGASPANGPSRSSTPGSGVGTPSLAGRHGAPAVSLPGRNVETVTLDPQHIMARNQLKRPIPDVIKDINRRSRVKVTMIPSAGGKIRFDAAGPQDLALQALKDVVAQIGTKETVKVPIPSSARAHIIGKQGSTIKAMQERSGARIQVPRVEDGAPYPQDDDDDAIIEVSVEGNTLTVAAGISEIRKIVNERSANVSSRMKDVPAEFFAFLGHNDFVSDLENDGVQVRVPPHQPYSAQPPVAPASGERYVFMPSPEDHIHLAGDRAAVQAARAKIERRIAELHRNLVLQQQEIPKGQQQFIIGERGIPMDDFFGETGCAIIIPRDEEDDVVSIVGPADRVDAALEKAMDLANNMKLSNYDLSRVHRQAPGGAAAHARNVTRYLRARNEIERLEKQYNTHINTPYTSEGALPWEFYSRDGKNAFRAQTELKGIVTGHPPSRMSTVTVDPFFHQYLQTTINPRVHQDYGVYLVVPEASEIDAPVLLVYEGVPEPDVTYQLPQTQPSPADLKAFEQGIRDTQKHILELLKEQDEIKSITIDVPLKYHDKLRRFIKQEQENRPANQPSIRVSSLRTNVIMKGPEKAVQALATKVEAFIAQEKEDEKERGFTLSFEFPQKYANHLIGKGGSHIRELREKFDVDIQVQDGMVELKGPKKKAEEARAHINSIGRTLADETTHTLKIEPKFHRELIGAQGSVITRLQERYKGVHIFYPRANRAKDDESADAASETGKPRRQQAPDEVVIRGPKNGADAARDEIWSLYQFQKDNSHTATITLQQKQVPYLIGQGGSAMEALRQETGAKIDVPNSRDSPESTVEVQIKGTKEQVAAAKKLLEAKKAVFDDTEVRSIEVDRKYHRALIGAGGSNIKDMVVKAGGSDDRRELSRTIQFPRQEADGNAIKVEGRKAVVDKLIAQIEEFVAERENQVSEVIDVPIEKHRSLIGRGGDVKRQMEADFKVSIDIPRQGNGQTGVTISGKPDDVEKAKAHIIEATKEQHGETVQVPRNLHHAVSNGGQFFRKMRGDLHVTIDHAGQPVPPRPSASTNSKSNGGPLPLITDDEEAAADAHSWNVVETTPAEDGEIPWVLHGSPENVEKAKAALEAALAQARKSNVVGYLVLPDPATYRHVIGHGGRKIDSIRKQSGCRINVPNSRNGANADDAIEVLGTKEGAEKAKDLILAAVREGIKGRD